MFGYKVKELLVEKLTGSTVATVFIFSVFEYLECLAHAR